VNDHSRWSATCLASGLGAGGNGGSNPPAPTTSPRVEAHPLLRAESKAACLVLASFRGVEREGGPYSARGCSTGWRVAVGGRAV
jgi:hypothetical protein